MLCAAKMLGQAQFLRYVLTTRHHEREQFAVGQLLHRRQPARQDGHPAVRAAFRPDGYATALQLLQVPKNGATRHLQAVREYRRRDLCISTQHADDFS